MKWETQMQKQQLQHLNNPKFTYKHVLECGELLYHDSQYDEFVIQLDKPRASKSTKQKANISINQLSLF